MSRGARIVHARYRPGLVRDAGPLRMGSPFGCFTCMPCRWGVCLCVELVGFFRQAIKGPSPPARPQGRQHGRAKTTVAPSAAPVHRAAGGSPSAQPGHLRLYVDINSPGPTRDGTSWERAYVDLQQGLAAAVSGDRILVADGTYKPTSGTNRTISFALKASSNSCRVGDLGISVRRTCFFLAGAIKRLIDPVWPLPTWPLCGSAVAARG